MGRDMGDAFQGVIGVEDSVVIGGRASGTVREIELECYLEMSGDEMIFSRRVRPSTSFIILAGRWKT